MHRGDAKITSPYTVEVAGRTINTRSIIVASGALPLVPPIPGLDEVGYLTSDTVWDLRELPSVFWLSAAGPYRMRARAIVQQSWCGCHTGGYGRPRIMPREDPEVSSAVAARFAEEGIKVLTDHRLVRFGNDNGTNFMESRTQWRNRACGSLTKVLLAIGARPT